MPLIRLARFGKPEEVAEVIRFLASPAASYVSGAQYTVGGGVEALNGREAPGWHARQGAR